MTTRQIKLADPLIFVHSKVIKKLNEFKEMADVIVTNRMTDDIKDMENKVYTRDLFGND